MEKKILANYDNVETQEWRDKITYLLVKGIYNFLKREGLLQKEKNNAKWSLCKDKTLEV